MAETYSSADIERMFDKGATTVTEAKQMLKEEGAKPVVYSEGGQVYAYQTYTAPKGTTYEGTTWSGYKPQNTIITGFEASATEEPTPIEEAAQASLISEHPPYTPMPTPYTQYGSIYSATLESELQAPELMRQTGGEILNVEPVGTNIMGGRMVNVTFAEPHPQLIGRSDIAVTPISELQHRKNVEDTGKVWKTMTLSQQRAAVGASLIFDEEQSKKMLGAIIIETEPKGILQKMGDFFTSPFQAGKTRQTTNQIFTPTPTKQKIAIETLTQEYERTTEWERMGGKENILGQWILRGIGGVQSIPAAPVTWTLGGEIAGGITIAGGKVLAPVLKTTSKGTGITAKSAEFLLKGGEQVAKHPWITTGVVTAGIGGLEYQKVKTMEKEGKPQYEIVGEVLGAGTEIGSFGFGFGKGIEKSLQMSAVASAKKEGTFLKAVGLTGERVEALEPKTFFTSPYYTGKTGIKEIGSGMITTKGAVPKKTFLGKAKEILKGGTQVGTTAQEDLVFQTGKGEVAVITYKRPQNVIAESKLPKRVKGQFKLQETTGMFGTAEVRKGTVVFIPTKTQTFKPPEVSKLETEFIKPSGKADEFLIDNLRVAWGEQKAAKIQETWAKEGVAKRKFLEFLREEKKPEPVIKNKEAEQISREFGTAQKYKLVEEERIFTKPEEERAVSLFEGQRTIYSPISLGINEKQISSNLLSLGIGERKKIKPAAISTALTPTFKQTTTSLAAQSQIMKQMMSQTQITGQKQTSRTTPIEEPRPVMPPPLPPFYAEFKGFELKGKEIPSQTFKFKKGYRPSLWAVGENIKAPKGWKVPKEFTGLEIRPLTWKI